MLSGNLNINNYKLSLIISVLLVSVILFSFGLFWESSESLHASIFYGDISSPPFEVWINECLLFQLPIISFISEYFESVPVYGIWHILIIILFTSLWLHIFIRVINRAFNLNPIITILLSILLLIAILGTSLSYVHFTREVVFLIAGSLILLVDYYDNDEKNPISVFLIFLFGCLLRISPAVMTLLIMTVFCLLYYRDIGKTFNLLKYYWLSMIVLALIVGGYKFLGDNAGFKIEQTSEYALCDRNAIVPISQMRSKQDTIKYRALKNYFLVMDSAQIKLDFIDRVIDNKKWLNLTLTAGDYKHFKRIMFPLFGRHSIILLFLYSLLFISVWNSNRNQFINFLVFNLIGWLVILAFGMKINMYKHFMLPWASVLAGTSLYLLYAEKRTITIFQKTLFSIALVFSINTAFSDYIIPNSKNEKDMNKRSATIRKKIGSISKEQIPIIWIDMQSNLSSDILYRNKNSILKKCVYQSMYFLMYHDYAQERCIEKLNFSPLDWKNMGLSLIKNRDKVCFIMEDDFARFLIKYYKTIYGIDFKLEKKMPEKEISPGVFVYTLNADNNLMSCLKSIL